MRNSLTIIVPTHNRSEFLRRLLLYFSRQNVSAQLLIADSSELNGFLQNAETVQFFSAKLNITHRFDQSGFVKKCRSAVELVQTPYSVFCADDDFLLLDSVATCLKFLDANDDYSCATGSWVSMDPLRKDRCCQTRCFAIDDHDPMARFRRLADNWFANFYCVFRTKELCRSWVVADEATEYERGRVFTELLLSHLATLYGRQAILPQLHLLFQLHDQNDHRTTPLVREQAATTELYLRFANGLANEMARVCQASFETCREQVDTKYGFWMTNAPKGVGQLAGSKRLFKNIRSQVLLLRDLVFRNPTNIWLRRKIRQDSALCQTDAWRQAYKMAAEYPRGVKEELLPKRTNVA